VKRTVFVLLSLLTLLIGACSQIQIPALISTPTTGPTINPDDLFKTAVAQTLTAQPTLPPSITDTATPVATSTPTPVLAVSDTATLVPSATLPVTDTPAGAAPTVTPVVDLSATSNVATATNLPANFTPNATLPVGQVTPVWTLAVRLYGTLPPAVPFSQVTLINKANTEAYISLQVTMPDGTYSILEYPVEGRIRIDAPVGSYLYVAWVGGRKMVGEFRLSNNDDLSITLFRDRIVIK
jgi:hypothetical protein